MNTILIGNGYWGNIIKPKLEKLTILKSITNSNTKLDQLKLDDIDYVFVCTPTKTHYNICRDLIIGGNNIFCEKPFTGDYEKAIELYELSFEYNVNIFIDNIFLYRPEILDINDNFNSIKFIWNKNDINHKENILDSLLYHDIYILISKSDDNWEIIDKYVDDETLNLKMVNGTKNCSFIYNRKSTHKEKLIIVDGDIIDLSNPKNDPLSETILDIKNENIDFKSNKDITIKTLKIIKNINDFNIL